MILVSGFNVYPNEVEDAAALHPGVREVAAVACRTNAPARRSSSRHPQGSEPGRRDADRPLPHPAHRLQGAALRGVPRRPAAHQRGQDPAARTRRKPRRRPRRPPRPDPASRRPARRPASARRDARRLPLPEIDARALVRVGGPPPRRSSWCGCGRAASIPTGGGARPRTRRARRWSPGPGTLRDRPAGRTAAPARPASTHSATGPCAATRRGHCAASCRAAGGLAEAVVQLRIHAVAPGLAGRQAMQHVLQLAPPAGAPAGRVQRAQHGGHQVHAFDHVVSAWPRVASASPDGSMTMKGTRCTVS